MRKSTPPNCRSLAAADTVKLGHLLGQSRRMLRSRQLVQRMPHCRIHSALEALWDRYKSTRAAVHNRPGRRRDIPVREALVERLAAAEPASCRRTHRAPIHQIRWTASPARIATGGSESHYLSCYSSPVRNLAIQARAGGTTNTYDQLGTWPSVYQGQSPMPERAQRACSKLTQISP